MGCCFSSVEEEDDKFLIAIKYDHASGINCICTSSDHSVIITGSEDKTIRVWSTVDYCECLGICIGHEDYINCIAMQDNYIVSGSADKTVRIWDVTSFEQVAILKGHNSLINRLILSDDYILSSSYDRTIRLWSFNDGHFIRNFLGHTRGVYPMILICNESKGLNGYDKYSASSSRSILISGSADFTAKLWSLDTGRCLYTFKGHRGAITCMGTDAVAKYLVTGSTDFTVRSWSIATGESLQIFEGHKGAVICMNVRLFNISKHAVHGVYHNYVVYQYLELTK